MKVTLLIMLGFVLGGGLAVFMVVRSTMDDVERQYSQAAEEPMVDVAHLLAALIEADLEDGVIDPSRFREAFERAHRREFEARIYRLHKTELFTHVYVTDSQGLVIFDSQGGKREGMDYASMRDVFLTLGGQYGARSTREDIDDSRSSVFYVAAPIRWKGETVGVLSVSRPETAMAAFVEETRAKILRTGAWASLLMVLLGMAWVYWLLSPIGQLTQSARQIKAGVRTAIPVKGVAELRALGGSLEEMRRELEGKHYVESYVQALTHEIKSPLSAIQGAAELLEEDEMSAEQRQRFLANIRAETKRCEEIVRRLVQLAALESQHELDRVEVVDLAELLREEAATLGPRLESQDLRIRLNLPGSEAGAAGSTPPASAPAKVWEVKGDRLALQLAIRNLLANAVDFSPAGGEIRLAMERADRGFIALTVEDDGPGIPDYAEGKLFERFYSLRNLVTGRKGSGLGLCFVREAAQLHRGQIDVSNRQPCGVRATLTLPV